MYQKFRRLHTPLYGLQYGTSISEDEPVKREEGARKFRVDFALSGSGGNVTNYIGDYESFAVLSGWAKNVTFPGIGFMSKGEEFVVIYSGVDEFLDLVSPEREYELFIPMTPLRVKSGWGEVVSRKKASPNPIFY